MSRKAGFPNNIIEKLLFLEHLTAVICIVIACGGFLLMQFGEGGICHE